MIEILREKEKEKERNVACLSACSPRAESEKEGGSFCAKRGGADGRERTRYVQTAGRERETHMWMAKNQRKTVCARLPFAMLGENLWGGHFHSFVELAEMGLLYSHSHKQCTQAAAVLKT
eukprot:2276865-Rhodomonas_salina.2